MAYIISVASQKGGVGKTTTAVNMAASLTKLGHKVLLVDTDPQGNASSGLGIRGYESAQLYHLIMGEKSPEDVCYQSSVEGLSVIPSNPDLVGLEPFLYSKENKESFLMEHLVPFKSNYDYIILDCPPSLGLLTINAFVAAHYFLVPLQCEYYALEGLSQLLHSAGLIKEAYNPSLHLLGIVLTMFDTRNRLSHQVVEDVKGYFHSSVFKTTIHRNVRLSEAPSHGQAVSDYAPESVGAKNYMDVTREVIIKVNQLAQGTYKIESVAGSGPSKTASF